MKTANLGAPVVQSGPDPLTEEQQALRDAVRGLLGAAARERGAGASAGAGPEPGQARPGNGVSPGPGGGEPGEVPSWRPVWDRLCREIGVAGLAVPEEYGGAGAGPVEIQVVAEELGRDLTPTPLLGSAVLAAQALLASGDTAACGRLLPGIAAGTTVAALAWVTEAGRWDPAAAACRARRAAGTGWALDGTMHYVLYGDCADVLLAVARAPDGTTLFEVDPGGDGVTRTPAATVDPATPLAVVRLSGATGRRIGGRDASAALTRARDLAAIALSAEQAGAARRALELTVSYTAMRVQFGRPIGSFQAVQHRLADLYVLVESARSAAYAAATAATAGTSTSTSTSTAGNTAAGTAVAGQPGQDGLELAAATARVACTDALNRAAAEMIQLHGAIGITWEHDAHRYLKHAHSSARLLGPPTEHLARVAAALLDR
jgi:alkylation response protein AidB-like acyl-CoA dehydrogenase